ncbi:MAG: hypothetical protein NTZ14_11545 [Hyphomicrobiales bacterium]|nr:hypothetical protein [Hyphomicrobiales bacterium]
MVRTSPTPMRPPIVTSRIAGGRGANSRSMARSTPGCVLGLRPGRKVSCATTWDAAMVRRFMWPSMTVTRNVPPLITQWAAVSTMRASMGTPEHNSPLLLSIFTVQWRAASEPRTGWPPMTAEAAPGIIARQPAMNRLGNPAWIRLEREGNRGLRKHP